MKVAVVGLGYVGTVTAACMASHGHDVWGVDVDEAKVSDIRSGRSPVAEPGLDDLVGAVVAGGTLHATTSAADALAGADLSLVCVGTPSTPRGGTDLSFIRRAVDEIGAAVRLAPPASGRHSLVIRSTVPPGTVDDLVAPALAAALAGSGIEAGAAMCPEFLREGTGLADFYDPPFIVVGASDPSVADAVTSLFSFLGRPVQVTAVRVAESLKYACNAFHATKVSFTNELARLFRLLGVDARDVMSLFCEDQVLNISPAYLRPGFAFGGSCLPKDLRSLLHLARLNGVDMPLLAGTMVTNELVISEVLDRVVAAGQHEIALLGLSFKMDTDDLRESPNVELAERLIGKGFSVRIYDPVVNPARLVGANRRTVESLQAQADAQRFQVEAAYLTLTANVVVAAITEAALRGQIDATNELIAANRKMLDITRRQLDAGFANRSDVAAQEAALAQVEATLPPLRKALAIQRDLLAALAGGYPSEEPREIFKLADLQLPQDLPLSLPSQLIEQRPDVRNAEELLHSASADVGVATAKMLPNFTIDANGGYINSALAGLISPANSFWLLAGNATQTVFDGFSLLHQLRGTKAAYDEAAWAYKSTVVGAVQNVTDALRALQNDADALKAARDFERAAKISFDLARQQVEAGNANVLLLLTAQSTYLQAVIQVVQARAARLADTAALFQALGGGWWNRVVPPKEKILNVGTGEAPTLVDKYNFY